jgi:hypothetical protein
VSDFYTPNFFDPLKSAGVRYSYTGALTAPRQVLDGGYLSWREPVSGHLWQLFVDDGAEEFVDRGPISSDWSSSLRRMSDLAAADHRAKAHKEFPLERAARSGLLLGAMAAEPPTVLDRGVIESARQLQAQIDDLTK